MSEGNRCVICGAVWHYEHSKEDCLFVRSLAKRSDSIDANPEPRSAKQSPDLHDMINHPPHYKSHPSGIECIEITKHMNFCLGNAVKYIWRAGLKSDALEDLKKAVWYLDKEILRLEAKKSTLKL